MDDHTLGKTSYGTDRAQLVYGLRADGTLAHISEVQRGLACGCTCPSCRGRLVARLKDEFKVAHFAHHDGEACGGGSETAIHLLAKEFFRSHPMMLLPERLGLDENRRVVTKPEQEVATKFLRMEYADPKDIVPDLFVRVLDYDLFVEVAVTHFSDEVKVLRLRRHGIPAVEIDLSRLPRDSSREAIADAMLRTARRHWLFHPGIDVANAKLRADEETRLAKLAEREANAKAAHRKRVEELCRAYREAPLHARVGDVPRLSEIQAVGLAEHVGIEVAGYRCFTVSPVHWQTILLAEVFHDRHLGNGIHKPVPITQHLEKAKLIRQAFRRVPGAVADDAAVVEPGFAPPWRAVDAYLKYLVGAGVLVRHGYGMVLADAFSKPWSAYTLAEDQRTAAAEEIVQNVSWILGELPDEERQNMVAETWLDSIHTESGSTYRNAIQSDVEAPKIGAEIKAIIAMMQRHGQTPFWSAGLPIDAAVERHKTYLTRQAEERRKKEKQKADQVRATRRDSLSIDVEQALSEPDRRTFLATVYEELGGMSLLDAAGDSDSGLTRARRLLSDFAERKRYQAKITVDAERALQPSHVDAFLHGRDDDLGRTTPLLFVKDETTYRKARSKLAEWEHEFGRLS